MIVPPICSSVIFWPIRKQNLTPKEHPLAFMGDTYTRRVLSRIRCGINICNVGLVTALLTLAFTVSAATDPTLDPVQISANAANLLIKKDVAWIALFIAGLSIFGMIAMGKFMKEMHVEYMKQQAEWMKSVATLTAEVHAANESRKR